MLKKIKKYIDEYNMLSKGDTIVVGVSGGADSICLLTILSELRTEYNLSLIAVHVNHMIRGEEADRDEQYVIDYCEKLGVPCRIFRYDVPVIAREQGLSEEETGRNLRYQAFNEVVDATNSGKIAVAHNRDDLAETVIFNMIRGSSIGGMAGIKPVRDNIIRPLLCAERREIEEYLGNKGIDYKIDSTNLSVDYTRNKIRNIILPEMKKINDMATEHICRVAGESEIIYQNMLAEIDFSIIENDRISVEKLSQLSAPKRNEVIITAIANAAGRRKDLTRKHVEAVAGLIDAENGKRVNLPYDIICRKNYEYIVIEKKSGDNESIDNASVPTCPDESRLKISILSIDDIDSISKKEYTKMLNYDKINGALTLRYPMDGDYIVIDSKGQKKKLTRLFTDRKIDREKREKWPVVAVENEILWAIGLRINEAYKVDEDTKQVAVLEWLDT